MIEAFRRVQEGSIRVKPEDLKDKYWALIPSNNYITQVKVKSCTVLTENWALMCGVDTLSGVIRQNVSVEAQDLFETSSDALNELTARARKQIDTVK